MISTEKSKALLDGFDIDAPFDKLTGQAAWDQHIFPALSLFNLENNHD
ncbi:MAG: hypothetical protein Q7T96_12830 [Methylobacter sp.]|nr:hypothetical protein [Methylobacter sp.]